MIYQGDCLEVMKTLPDNSVDAVITDPPYELNFMGKKWDNSGIAYKIEMWVEVLRVLKHGGHLLAFGGTRTQHRMVCAIEDAGFQIRNQIVWAYSTGFPKSLNIGKKIDEIQGNEREFVGHSQYEGRRPNKFGGSKNGDICYGDYKAQPEMLVTKGNSDFEGWGTDLKPALETICMARKPLEKGLNIAENCLKWGCGGLNIDGSRIEGQWNGKTRTNSPDKKQVYGDYGKIKTEEHPQGRFPANLILDDSEEVRACFPETKSGSILPHHIAKESHNLCMSGKNYERTGKISVGDSGNASRFFKSIIYQAKASKSERNFGCGGLEKKISGTNVKGYLGDGVHDTKPRQVINYNNHPTVKPVALMEYLINLITRAGQTVLDPFTGSGTTGVACKKLGREFIGIELNPDYIEIAEKRIAAHNNIFEIQEEVAV